MANNRYARVEGVEVILGGSDLQLDETIHVGWCVSEKRSTDYQYGYVNSECTVYRDEDVVLEFLLTEKVLTEGEW